MITLLDTVRLSMTKLRTRKIRTIITVLLASMLFGVLVAASLIITGASRSIESFREDGLTSRYIVKVVPVLDQNAASELRRDPQLIAEAKKRYEQLVEEKTAEAERLGLRYTQASDQPPYTQSPDGKEEYLRPSLGDRTGIVHDLLEEKYRGIPVIDDGKLEATARQYGAINTFHSEWSDLTRRGTLDVFPDGKEVFYDQSDEAENNANYVRPILDPAGMVFAPSEITEPFMLSSNAGWQPDSASIPIIMPQNAVERLLEKDVMSDEMSAAEKLDHLKQLRNDAASLSFQACYRNNASKALIQRAIQQQNEMKANVGKDDYQKPSLIYELPDPSKCESPTVVSDTRTANEKERDENQKLFDEKFGSASEPVSYFVPFKIVGISPPQVESSNPIATEQQAESIDDVIDDLLSTNGVGQAIPRELYNQLAEDSKEKYASLFVYEPAYFIGNEDNKERYVEFANATDAQKFINEQGCETQVDGKCHPEGREYMLSLAFTNSAALDDIRSRASEWFSYAMIGVVILAAVVMWITIGRAIADGRRETAVFRAIGFKRIDIASVYVLYTILLTVLVAAFAATIGWFGAYIIHQQLSPDMTAQAQNAFGGLDLSKEMSFIGVDQQQLLLILTACFATGLLSMIIPLLSNVRRSPIRDMRDE